MPWIIRETRINELWWQIVVTEIIRKKKRIVVKMNPLIIILQDVIHSYVV